MVAPLEAFPMATISLTGLGDKEIDGSVLQVAMR
jgi:hypothetical protein